jgi:elongation factor 2
LAGVFVLSEAVFGSDVTTRLAKLDPTARCLTSKRGECIIAGVGELHIDICIRAISDIAGCEVTKREPHVSHVETVTAVGPCCLAKSSNKHNRAYVRVEPLAHSLVADIESGRVRVGAAELVDQLASEHSWARADARKVLAIHQPTGCMLVDATSGLDIGPVLPSLLLGFTQVCEGGPLCDEPVRAVKFVLTDAK